MSKPSPDLTETAGSHERSRGQHDDVGPRGLNWTTVLRRRPARIVAGEALGGYTDLFEIICCDCGDHPDLDYREVSPELQRIRGPYRFPAAAAAYKQHLRWRQHRQGSTGHAGCDVPLRAGEDVMQQKEVSHGNRH